jgi:endonuclease III
MKHDYFKKLDIALRKKFGEPRKCCEEPTAALVRGILSQNTTDKNRDRAFIELRRKFAAWEETLAAEESQIAGAIRVAGMANQRAARIRELLQWLKDNNRGRIDARFLLKMSPSMALAQKPPQYFSYFTAICLFFRWTRI